LIKTTLSYEQLLLAYSRSESPQRLVTFSPSSLNKVFSLGFCLNVWSEPEAEKILYTTYHVVGTSQSVSWSSGVWRCWINSIKPHSNQCARDFLELTEDKHSAHTTPQHPALKNILWNLSLL